MKLNFRESTLVRYSFKDLEYGMVLLNAELDKLEHELSILKKYGIDKYRIDRERITARKPILEKIAIIENEIGDRMLTGNDDGMLERELLGAEA